MPYVAKASFVGTLGCDTSETLDAAKGATLRTLGIKFAVRYVAQSYQAPTVGMQAGEMAALTGAGLDLMLVQFARTGGWSQATGAADGTAAAKNALALGYPKTACLWVDVEGAIPSAPDCLAYVNAWARAATDAGMASSALGMYVGPGVPLSPAQLYEQITLARYWRAGAIVPNVDRRGFQMLQLYPGNVTIPSGIVIDYDVIQEDFFNVAPVLCAAA